MKKWIALLLAAMMAMAAVPAFAAQGDALLGRGEDGEETYFRGAFADGDTLYLSSYEGLYTYHAGDADMVRYDFEVGDEADETNVAHYPFVRDGQLYSIDLFTIYREYSEFVKAEITPYALEDGKVVASGTPTAIDWTSMLQYYDQDCYPIEPQDMYRVGAKLFLMYYNEQGDRAWKTIDLDSMRMDDLPDFTDVVSATPYRDDTLLLQLYNYSQPTTVRFQVYDPKDESIQPLSEIEIDSYNFFYGLAYNAATDTLYCVKGGEICPLDPANGEVGEGITDMPIETYGNSGACIFGGSYYACASSGAAVRNLDPDQKAAYRLKIYDGIWSDAINNAYYRYTNANGDVNVVLSRDESDARNIIESMMNRDSSVDIYVMNTSVSDYEAVHNRGYMMELDGSQNIAALADSMYPSIREAMCYNGRVVALPVEVYGWTMAANEKALAQIGLTLDDVPKNWSDFLDFLAALPERIPEGSPVKPFYADQTVENVRSQLFYQIFNDYQNYVNATDPAIGYNTELLRSLLAKLESIDFEAFGYELDDDSREGVMYSYSSGDEDMRLFDVSVGCTFGNFYSDFVPMLMSMDAQTPAFLMLQMSVAFVNPFTKYPDKALAFMEELADNLPDTLRYSLIPSLNEPIRGAYNEKNLKELQEELENLKRQRDAAGEQDKQAIEESIRDWEENLEYAERYGWDISQESIDWYRANDDNIAAVAANWLYDADSGEAWNLMMQYMQGLIGSQEMLESIDKKVQMKLLEGN